MVQKCPLFVNVYTIENVNARKVWEKNRQIRSDTQFCFTLISNEMEQGLRKKSLNCRCNKFGKIWWRVKTNFVLFYIPSQQNERSILASSVIKTKWNYISAPWGQLHLAFFRKFILHFLHSSAGYFLLDWHIIKSESNCFGTKRVNKTSHSRLKFRYSEKATKNWPIFHL